MVFEPASLNMYNTTCLHMQCCCNCTHYVPSLHLHLFSLLAALLYINLVVSLDAENINFAPIGKKRRKPLSECSFSHCQRLKKEAASQCSASLSCLTGIGLVPYSVKVFNTETNEREELCLEVRDEATSRLNDHDLVSIALVAKDKYIISGMLCIFVCISYSVQKCIFMLISFLLKGYPIICFCSS